MIHPPAAAPGHDDPLDPPVPQGLQAQLRIGIILVPRVAPDSLFRILLQFLVGLQGVEIPNEQIGQDVQFFGQVETGICGNRANHSGQDRFQQIPRRSFPS
jgi:hypothetical protein